MRPHWCLTFVILCDCQLRKSLPWSHLSKRMPVKRSAEQCAPVPVKVRHGLTTSKHRSCYVPAMRLQAPISHHLDLYRYCLAKREGRSMPARGDLDAADIPTLLPYLM